MAQLYTAGERKKRPGTYYRYSNAETYTGRVTLDGINAIVIQSSWGPTNTVTTHQDVDSIVATYGNSAGAQAAKMLKEGGAQKIYIVRPEGTSGAAASASLQLQADQTATVTAKCLGDRALSVKIQKKPGSETVKQFIVLDGTTRLEMFEFPVHESDETTAAKAAVAESQYITMTTTGAGVFQEAETKLIGGANPTLTPQDYLAGFQLLEPFRYSVLTTDSTDEDVNIILQGYVADAEVNGKLIIGVVGPEATNNFEDLLDAAKACNSKNIVYFGSTFSKAHNEAVTGANAINYAAGVISATPSNQSIIHTVVGSATDIAEKLTNEQYEQAIDAGLLLLSTGPDGQIWFDSGINTLIEPDENEDAGWKKIKRVKVRYELLDRIDRVVAPLIGKVNCDADGIAAVVQAGMGVISSMIAEKKILPGGTMIEDPDNPAETDSAWFIIQVDDIDSLEKVYLHYKFRNSAS